MAVQTRNYYRKGDRGFKVDKQARAVWRKVRMSASKVRLVADIVRGKHIDEALAILSNTSLKGARKIEKVLKSAIANAEQKGLDIEKLHITRIFVDEGPTMKRVKPRAMGRANLMKRRTCHITIIVGEL